MSATPDPWDTAASEILAARRHRKDATEDPKASELITFDVALKHYKMTMSVVKLARLLGARGDSARRLLAAAQAASDQGQRIIFGGMRNGHDFTSVGFTADGLEFYAGTITGGVEKIDTIRPATVKEAVEFAVEYGKREPDKIVNWFIEALDALAKRFGVST